MRIKENQVKLVELSNGETFGYRERHGGGEKILS